eukprot:TRINITY_DN93014_c0_g1_i1.p1 TRINITY_DN93014_c0_g1~~TRINITY_DN93014_c0_g1_i1.p1  ORF type:complete len:372 (-),score=67.95 TRINITY_DN93014_c0_g1_i1:77-1192(-)
MECRVLEKFQAWDMNQDGVFSEDELTGLFEALGHSGKEISAMLAAADTNRDGKIDYKEFLSWIFAEASSAVKDYVGMKLQFTTKPDCDNYADCDGTYIMEPSVGTINGKPIYVNGPKAKFLAATSSDGGWCIAALVYLDQVKAQGGGGFGGFHAAGGDEPEDGEWMSYDVNCCISMQFVTKDGCENYGNCDGEYELDHGQGSINGKPIYVNRAKNTFLASTSSEKGWCIASLVYLDQVKAQGSGSFGGLHGGGGDQPEEGDWQSYHVTCSGRRAGQTKMTKRSADQAAVKTKTKLSSDQAAELKKSFEEMDANKNGVVTKEELITLIKGLGEGVTNDVFVTVKEMIQIADQNGDGKIQFEEFYKAATEGNM